MPKYVKNTAVVVLAILLTIASLSIVKLGEPYYCAQFNKYPELRREERGIPLTIIKRSIQGTGCMPSSINDRPLSLEEQNHSIKYVNLASNVIFWYIILTILSLGFKKIEKTTPSKQKNLV